jgi:hypothetical protein
MKEAPLTTRIIQSLYEKSPKEEKGKHNFLEILIFRPPLTAIGKEELLPALANLISSCWEKDRDKRPPFRQIVPTLGELILDYSISDQEGRNFWRKNFFDDKGALVYEEVGWAVVLEEFQRVYNFDQQSLAYLEEVLG